MIVGIDIGTQSLKAVVTDTSLKVIGEAAVAYQPAHPQPGWADQNPQLWLDALAPAIRQALKAAKVGPQDIQALGLCGQLDGCLAADARGRALTDCLIWLDRRAEAELEGIDADEVYARCGVVLDPTHMAAKIRWLKRNTPGLKQPCVFHQPVSWLLARLTGKSVFDHGLASTTMLYSLERREFDDDLLEAFEIDPGELPAIAEADSCAGPLSAQGAELTGLPAGLPVAVGTGDDFSSPLGAGMVSPGPLACVLGTAEVVGALHPSPRIDERRLVETHAYAGGMYFIENPGWLSGGTLSWFLKTFRLKNFRELDELAAEVCPGAEGLTFLPAMSGAMTPEWIASARGAFYGLTPAHQAGHMARAVLEGCAFAMRDVGDRLIEMGLTVQSLRLMGGGARSELWSRMRADLTGLNVEIPDRVDASPVGAALLASVAAGLLPDRQSAARALLEHEHLRVIEPDLSLRAAYEEAYMRYRRLFDSLRPMFGEGAGSG